VIQEVVVYKDRIQTVEKIIEQPIITEKVIEIEKIVEVIKEVEKIVYKDTGDDCMTKERFMNIWNQLFQLKHTQHGQSQQQCLGEADFVDLVSGSIMNNANLMTQSVYSPRK
jgi:predicted RNA-binding protein with EMAP domain